MKSVEEEPTKKKREIRNTYFALTNDLRREEDSEFWEISSFVTKCIKVLRQKQKKNAVYNIISIDLPWENFASSSYLKEMVRVNGKFFASPPFLSFSLSLTACEFVFHTKLFHLPHWNDESLFHSSKLVFFFCREESVTG